MSKNGHGNSFFWCGFCETLLPQLQPQSQHSQHQDSPVRDDAARAWEVRIKHIGDHFDKEGFHIDDWVGPEQDPAKKYIMIDDCNDARRRTSRGHVYESEGSAPVWGSS